MSEGVARFDGPHAYIFQHVLDDTAEDLEIGGRKVAEFVAIELGLGGASWLANIVPPSDATEFRFVVQDDSYESGFRTSEPVAPDEHPSDAADRMGIGEQVVRVIYGKP